MIKGIYSISAAITLASNAFLISLLFTPEPSAGHLWPKPLYHCHGEQTLRLSQDFEFVLPTNVHPRLADSASRYRRRILKSTFVSPVPPSGAASASSSSPTLSSIKNVLTSGSAPHASSAYELQRIVVDVEDALAEAPLGPDTDESYRLLIAADEEKNRHPFDISKSHCEAIRNGVILPGLQAHIRAKTIYGAMHAFETFSQLVVNTESTTTQSSQSTFSTQKTPSKIIPNAPIVIHDRPLFQHRGLLLDTSRNFLTVAAIKRTLDAMVMNKMNVFHWHLIDSQSFPLQLDDTTVRRRPSSNRKMEANTDSNQRHHHHHRQQGIKNKHKRDVNIDRDEEVTGNDEDEILPLSQLAAKGAYSAALSYTKLDIADVVSYALDRGIRIIPEIDMPGHAWVWSQAFPEIMVCPDGPIAYAAEQPTGQLNPTSEKTYRVIDAVYAQVAPLFPDQHFHGGSDEINFRCWNSSKIITDYLEEHGHSNTDTASFDWILDHFVTRQHQMLRGHGKTPVVWEEVVLNHQLNYIQHNKDTIIQVWTSAENIKRTIQRGYNVIVGSADYWYLDCGFGSWVVNDVNGNSWCDPYKTWQKIYSFNPLKGLTQDEVKNVLGGEVLLWGEQVLWSGNSDDSPNTLWDGPDQHHNTLRTAEAILRINEHRFRMLDEGIHAEPLMPMWCVKRPGHCNT
ncbi:hypothetical protein BGW42_005797 [Actinomortierella wolfii]|nr:hypothetical protein BGW42_005797 [Actinomortierella wolfii]